MKPTQLTLLVLVFLFHIGFSWGSNCPVSNAPTGSRPLVSGQNLCGEGGTPSMVLSIDYDNVPQTFDIKVNDITGETIFNEENIAYDLSNSNQITIADVNPGYSYLVELAVRNCAGVTNNVYNITCPDTEAPRNSISTSMITCLPSDNPLINIDVGGVRTGSLETTLDVCVGTSEGSCDLVDVTDSKTESQWELELSYDQIIFIDVHGQNCAGQISISENFTQETPTGPSVSDSPSLSKRNNNAFSTECEAFLELSTSGLEGPSWDDIPGGNSVCYYPTGSPGDENCQSIIGNPFRINNLEFDTEYFVEVIRSDNCTDSSASVNGTVSTNPQSTEPIDSSNARFDSLEITYYNIDFCAATLDISWTDFVYDGTNLQFNAAFNVTVTDNNNNLLYSGEVYQTTELNQVPVELGTDVQITVLPNNCGILSSEPLTDTITIAPQSTPVEPTPDLSFTNGLTSWDDPGSCQPLVDIEWATFENANLGYLICVDSFDQKSCQNLDDYDYSTNDTSISIAASPGRKSVSIRGQNCRGVSSEKFASHTFPEPRTPELNTEPFTADNPRPRITVTPSCNDVTNATIEYRGWNGYIDYYEICVDGDCQTTTDTQFNYQFAEPSRRYNIEVSAGNCEGKAKYSTDYYLESDASPQLDDAYLLLEATPDSSCNYDFTGTLEDFTSVQTFSYCISESDCSVDTDTEQSTFSTKLSPNNYNVKVAGNSCGEQSEVLEDSFNLYTISKPQFSQGLSTQVNYDGDCERPELQVSFPGVIDQENWYTGSYSACIQKTCTESDFVSVSDTVYRKEVQTGETYNVSVIASNCNGATTASVEVTVPENQNPSADDVYLHYKLSSNNNGCNREAVFYWNDFVSGGKYRYCISYSDFESDCGDQYLSWDTTNTNQYLENSIDVRGQNQTLYFGIVGENCKGFSEPKTITAFIPESSSEELEPNAEDASISVQYYMAFNPRSVKLVLNGEGFTLGGRPYGGSYQGCIGSSPGACDIEAQAGQSNIEVVVPEENLGEQLYASILPFGTCLSNQPVSIEFTPTIDAPDDINLQADVTIGCNTSRYVTISWDQIKSGVDELTATLVSSDGTEIATSNDIKGLTSYTFSTHPVFQGETYNVSMLIGQGVEKSTQTVEITIPGLTSIGTENAEIESYASIDEEFNIFLNIEASGFSNLASNADLDYCVGRNEGRCSSSAAFNAAQTFNLNRYVLDRQYYITARASNCDTDRATISNNIQVPSPGPISTANAQIETTTAQSYYCGASISVTPSGFTVSGARHTGLFYYCVGSSTGSCNIVSWTQTSSSNWNINIPVVDYLEYYVNVYASNRLGDSSIVSSSALTFPNYGCCLAPLSDSENSEASISVTSTSCSNGSPNPAISLNSISGIVDTVEYCVGSSDGACDIQGSQTVTVTNSNNVALSFDSVELSQDVYLSVAPGNCRSSLSPITTIVSGRPNITDENTLGLRQTDSCGLEGTVPAVSSATSYEYCIGSSSGNCDIVSLSSINAGDTISVSGSDISLDTTYYVQVVPANCYGKGSTVEGSLRIDSSQCEPSSGSNSGSNQGGDSGDTSASSFMSYSPVLLILSMLLMFVIQ